MMYPIAVKIDFPQAKKAARLALPVEGLSFEREGRWGFPSLSNRAVEVSSKGGAVTRATQALEYDSSDAPLRTCVASLKAPSCMPRRGAQSPKPVLLTLIINWLVKPLTMVVFPQFFLGWLFQSWLSSTEIIRGVEVTLANSYKVMFVCKRNS